MKKKNVLIIGSDLHVKGGMVSVIKNYLEYDNWTNTNIAYIPCYIEKGPVGIIIYYLLSLMKIRKFIKKNQVDLVHLHMAERGSFFRKSIIVRMCKKREIKVIIHHHGAEFEQFYNSSSALIKKYIRYILYLADLNMVLSNRLVNMVHNINPDAKVKVLYNAVKTYEDNKYNSLGHEILFLGRLGERKGIYDLLQAIKQIEKQLPEEIIFNLCGDGEIEKVKRKCREYGIEHRINHVGWIDSKKREEILKQTIIHMLPSYNEGLPMSILETMAYGIPNISTSIASIPEVITSGKNGYLIEPGNVDDLAFYIEKLVKDISLRKTMSEESYELIKYNFSLQQHMKQLEQYYEEVIRNVYKSSFLDKSWKESVLLPKPI